MICPLMSRPMSDEHDCIDIHFVDCQKEKCPSWDEDKKTNEGFCVYLNGYRHGDMRVSY